VAGRVAVAPLAGVAGRGINGDGARVAYGEVADDSVGRFDRPVLRRSTVSSAAESGVIVLSGSTLGGSGLVPGFTPGSAATCPGAAVI
jgi:hypothetical protein